MKTFLAENGVRCKENVGWGGAAATLTGYGRLKLTHLAHGKGRWTKPLRGNTLI
jgi:hypothetical protein